MFACNCPEATCQSPFRPALRIEVSDLDDMPTREKMRKARAGTPTMSARVFHADCDESCHWVRRFRPEPSWKR